MTERTLGKGFIGENSDHEEETTLYITPNNTQTRTTMLTLVNNGSATVALNVYKKVNGVNYTISPSDMIFPAKYLAQEDNAITLDSNDSIVATSSIDNVVSFIVNGIETIKGK